MKIEVICIGKTTFTYLNEGIALYQKRVKHYLPFDWTILPDLKKSKQWSEEQIKIAESEILLKKIPDDGIVILLDVKGKQLNSEDFSTFINHNMISGAKKLIFIIGGAYGFSKEMYKRANFKISLSKMTFSHQLVRVLFLEQLYRAMTILKGEPYHH